MSDFISRLREEKNDLGSRMLKLYEFINSEKFRDVDGAEQDLLRDQFDAMSRYHSALCLRLKKHEI